MAGERILVVDDEANMRRTVSANLTKRGYSVASASCGRDAVDLAASEQFDLLITDLKMPDMEGIEVFREIRALAPDIVAVMITGHASIESAVTALRAGIYDYLVKPFNMDEALVAIERALEHRRLSAENVRLRRELADKHRLENIVGKSDPMQQVYELVHKVAGSETTVLLRGESGTGKEMFARAIHYNSGRGQARFVAVACGALPETLLESELFGHERGAFTGAVARKEGLFEAADGGTIFLDEIGDLTQPVQMKLLRVLQEREFMRVGSHDPIHVSVRVISATHRKLEDLVRSGDFREDLYYRVNVVSIKLPPLRDRQGDVPLLIRHFLAKYGADDKRFSDESMRILAEYTWPGNVRELENVVERAVTLAEGDEIDPGVLPERLLTGGLWQPDDSWFEGHTLHEARDRFEVEYLTRMMRLSDGNISEAARRAGISRRHFYEKLRDRGVDYKAERPMEDSG